MRTFCLLFATLAFASQLEHASQHASQLEHGTQQPVTRNFLGKEWTRIFSCNQNSADVLPNIPELARTATQVLITHNDGYNERYVYSQPDTYPIRRLRAGQTLSFQISPPATTAFASQAVIQQTWVGPSDLLARLWNDCGSAGNLYPKGTFYWACNNQNGLHLGANGATCMWDWKQKYYRPIEIYINAGARPGCATCRTYEGKQWSRNYSCTNTDSKLELSVADTIGLANKAQQVLINNHHDYYVTSVGGSYPIRRLREGQTISHPFPPNNYAEKADITANWKGPQYLLDALWNTCGNTSSIENKMYWACNNGEGLHLSAANKRCEWDYLTYAGPIEVFIDAPCQCPGDYAPPPPQGYYGF